MTGTKAIIENSARRLVGRPIRWIRVMDVMEVISVLLAVDGVGREKLQKYPSRQQMKMRDLLCV
ncbi:hypothetical protein AA100600_0017 [Gluconobacter thailandicus F149-1 = NBRC 100600]|nr:hypothetical protein AA100600_0017 [Gluconobacter thailandicus F149-1 = NBRC 100600]